MKTAIVIFPGSNCDRDVAAALEQFSKHKPIMLWYQETKLPQEVGLVVIPGGFSYGDYLRSGAIAANTPIMREILVQVKKGLPVLGICNGFQILIEAGLLPGTLIRNSGLRFICKDVFLLVENTDSLFTKHYRDRQVIRMPIAHSDGNYFINDDGYQRLLDNTQIAFRYCSSNGIVCPAVNPNGSRENIAGIFSRDRRILGLMPHPERAADLQLGGSDGRAIFDSIAEIIL